MAQIEHVLITGGCGFIGSNLVRFLAEGASVRVRVIDDLRTGNAAHVPENLAEVHIGDAADPQAMATALDGVDAVVHLASQTGVAPSVEDPASDFHGNAATTFGVLEACRRRGISRLVFASSGAAVGEVTPPIHEEVVPRPVSPYGASKLAGEAYCAAFAASFGMQAVALRFSNVYGPFSAHKKNAVPNFIKQGITGEPIVIYGDGGQTRDFIFVEDLCEAIRRALITDDVGGEVFQVATGVETSIRRLAEMIQGAVGGPDEIRFEAGRAGEVYKSSVDISKIRRVLGFDPAVSLEDGLARTTAWFREHWSPSAG
jgi:UDP-glucose 4-epimerase